MVDEPNILTKDQEAKLTKYFDSLVVRAEAEAPSRKDYKDNPGDYDAAAAAFNSNPIAGYITRFKAERKEAVDAGTSQDKAEDYYQSKIADLKQHFITSAKRGAPDPDAQQKQQGIIDRVMELDFMGAIKAFIMSLPIVGDFIAGALKCVKSQFGSEKLGFSQARERITLERSLSGAAATMGLEGEAYNNFIHQGIHAYEDPNFKVPERQTAPSSKPTASTSQPRADASAAQPAPVAKPAEAAAQPSPANKPAGAPTNSVRPDASFDAPNGSLPPPPATTPSAPPGNSAAPAAPGR